jgi:hypothetical protein
MKADIFNLPGYQITRLALCLDRRFEGEGQTVFLASLQELRIHR